MRRLSVAKRFEEPTPSQLRALVEQAPDGIFTADMDGRYTFANAAAANFLGFSREEIVGKRITDLLAESDAARLLETKARMLRGETHIANWRMRRKDGGWATLEVSAKILPDGQWQAIARDASAREAQRAEREARLESSEVEQRWLQAVIDALPIGVALYRSGRQTVYNRRSQELMGMTLSGAVGSAQYAGRILFPDGRPVPHEALVSTRVMRHHETIVGEEYVIERPDGSRIPTLAGAAPIEDADGRVIGAVGVVEDISERKRAEEIIREEERLLRSIFEILPVGIWVADRSGRIVNNNPAGQRIWRGARYVGVQEFGEYKGWWVETGEPIAAEEWALARALTRGEVSTGELVRIRCFDGSFKTILNSAVPLRDEDGSIAGGIVVNEDITALHEAQEKLRASERLLRTVFDLLPVGLWVADRDGRIVLANAMGDRIWQGTRYIGPDQFHEYKAWWIETGQPIAPEEWGLSRAIRLGETSRSELIRIQCFDGSFKTIVNWAAPLRSDTGEITGAIAVNEDVTALQHTQEQLRAAVRDREELLAIVAHDLRNPLATITMTATLAEQTAKSVPGAAPLGAMAGDLLATARRMAELVDDLLAVAVEREGRSMLRLAPIQAGHLVARAVDAARRIAAERALRLETSIAEDLPALTVDVNRILRVFANLLDNAAKFTAPGGRILVTADAASGGVRFSVANSGDALPAATIEAMFKPFWQAASDDRRGAGLGLAICRSIVEAHGGSIWAEPAQGERVRLCCVLPRAAPLA